jgi:hypothetical protein
MRGIGVVQTLLGSAIGVAVVVVALRLVYVPARYPPAALTITKMITISANTTFFISPSLAGR